VLIPYRIPIHLIDTVVKYASYYKCCVSFCATWLVFLFLTHDIIRISITYNLICKILLIDTVKTILLLLIND
jgi:hypothetical protein